MKIMDEVRYTINWCRVGMWALRLAPIYVATIVTSVFVDWMIGAIVVLACLLGGLAVAAIHLHMYLDNKSEAWDRQLQLVKDRFEYQEQLARNARWDEDMRKL